MEKKEAIKRALQLCEFEVHKKSDRSEYGVATILGADLFGFPIDETVSIEEFERILDICCNEQGLINIIQFADKLNEDAGSDKIKSIANRAKLNRLIAESTK